MNQNHAVDLALLELERHRLAEEQHRSRPCTPQARWTARLRTTIARIVHHDA